MEGHLREISYFERSKGKYPYREWLLNFRDQKTVSRFDVRLRKVSMGNLGHHRSVGEGVIELIEDFGPGYRIYAGQDGQTLVVILCGGDKRTQSKDIQRAKEYWEIYKSRKET